MNERIMTTRNARVIVAALGSTGDVNPMLGIASELRRRGHDVVFLANPVFSRFAEAARLSFTPLGTEKDYEFIWKRRAWQWWRCLDTAFRECWVPHLRPLYDAIRSLARSTSAVIVANIVAAGAQIASEKLGLPLVVVSPSSLVFPSLEEFPDYGPLQRAPRWLGRPARRLFYRFGDAFVDFWIAKGWNALRAEIGLPATRNLFSRWVSAGHRVIGLWPEWWAKPQTSWPAQVVLTGFLNYDRSDLETEGGPSVLGEADRPVVFTCGSAMTHARAFVGVAVGVRRILRRRVLVVTDRPFELSSALPAGVECLPYVPFRRLLPQAAAVVHHGGIGTCAASLAAGIPQVIVPLAFDQFDNAERSEKLGVARRVSRLWFRPKRVARLVQELTGSKEVTARCRHVQAQIDSEAALQRACEAVEGLLPRADGTSRPQGPPRMRSSESGESPTLSAAFHKFLCNWKRQDRRDQGATTIAYKRRNTLRRSNDELGDPGASPDSMPVALRQAWSPGPGAFAAALRSSSSAIDSVGIAVLLAPCAAAKSSGQSHKNL